MFKVSFPVTCQAEMWCFMNKTSLDQEKLMNYDIKKNSNLYFELAVGYGSV